MAPISTTAPDAAFALRVAVQRCREVDGLGGVRLWNESAADFQAFVDRLASEMGSRP